MGLNFPLPFLSSSCLEHDVMAGALAAPPDHEPEDHIQGHGSNELGGLFLITVWSHHPIHELPIS